ncbi:MAG: c-type cytochrome domain-containing protein, partial [Pirellulales bacterium]
MLRVAASVVAAVGMLAAAQARADEQPAAADLEFFENKVRPLLVERCYKCHSAQAETLRGGLLLDSREGWTKGGDSGPAIVPGDPAESLLVQAVEYGDDGVQMPPDGKLPAEEIAILREWVRRG